MRALEQLGVGVADRAQLPLEGQVPVLERPLRHVLELAGQLDRGHEVVLVEHHLGLGLEAPRIGVDLARLARPDLLAVLVHLAGHAHDARRTPARPSRRRRSGRRARSARPFRAGAPWRRSARKPCSRVARKLSSDPVSTQVLATGGQATLRALMADDELHLIGPGRDRLPARPHARPAQDHLDGAEVAARRLRARRADVHASLREVLDKLPDEHAIRSIDISRRGSERLSGRPHTPRTSCARAAPARRV